MSRNIMIPVNQPRRDKSPVIFPWRGVFFAINFSVAVLLTIVCVWNILRGMGGQGASDPQWVFFLIPVLAFAWAEWRLYVSRAYDWERALGALCGIFGLFIVLVFIIVAVVSIASGDSPGLIYWLILGGFYLAAAAYALLCCWIRSGPIRTSTPEGFAVALSQKVKEDGDMLGR